MSVGRQSATTSLSASSLLPVAVLTLIWGCNWPVLKMGVTEIAPLTFRAITLPLAALGLLAVAHLSGDSIRVPRALWGKVATLALFNIACWNGLVLFGVQQLPAGRSAILAYTMPIWSVLFSLVLLSEPLGARRIAGMALGMLGMALLLGDDIRHLRRTPTAALLILGAAIGWALGTVLLRKWKVPIAQNTLSGWMMLLGWIPIAILAPLFAPAPLAMPSGERLVRHPLQHLPRRDARALGVVHARADAARRRVVDVVAAGPDRRRVLRDASARRTPRSERVDGARARRRGDGTGAVVAEAAAGADDAGRLSNRL